MKNLARASLLLGLSCLPVGAQDSGDGDFHRRRVDIRESYLEAARRGDVEAKRAAVRRMEGLEFAPAPPAPAAVAASGGSVGLSLQDRLRSASLSARPTTLGATGLGVHASLKNPPAARPRRTPAAVLQAAAIAVRKAITARTDIDPSENDRRIDGIAERIADIFVDEADAAGRADLIDRIVGDADLLFGFQALIEAIFQESEPQSFSDFLAESGFDGSIGSRYTDGEPTPAPAPAPDPKPAPAPEPEAPKPQTPAEAESVLGAITNFFKAIFTSIGPAGTPNGILSGTNEDTFTAANALGRAHKNGGGGMVLSESKARMLHQAMNGDQAIGRPKDTLEPTDPLVYLRGSIPEGVEAWVTDPDSVFYRDRLRPGRGDEPGGPNDPRVSNPNPLDDGAGPGDDPSDAARRRPIPADPADENVAVRDARAERILREHGTISGGQGPQVVNPVPDGEGPRPAPGDGQGGSGPLPIPFGTRGR